MSHYIWREVLGKLDTEGLFHGRGVLRSYFECRRLGRNATASFPRARLPRAGPTRIVKGDDTHGSRMATGFESC